MPMELQAKLLRVLEEKRVLRLGGMSFIPVDVRVLAASCRDLQLKVRENSFRNDLFFRINVVSVNIPPLRERRVDISMLARHFMAKYSKRNDDSKKYLQPEILTTLQAYDWPGNVRELSNWVERILAVGNVDDGQRNSPMDTPIVDDGNGHTESANPMDLTNRLGEAEAFCIAEAIEKNKFIISKAAAQLGISRSTLYKKMAKHGIEGRGSKD